VCVCVCMYVCVRVCVRECVWSGVPPQPLKLRWNGAQGVWGGEMYRPKGSKDFFTDFSFSYFLSFLSLFSEKRKQIATFCTKLIIDFGRHDRISGKIYLDDAFWKTWNKKTNKKSRVTWNCPQCFLMCRTVQTGSIMSESKNFHTNVCTKLLKKAVPVAMVPRLDKCWDAYVTESKSCFIFYFIFSRRYVFLIWRVAESVLQ